MVRVTNENDGDENVGETRREREKRRTMERKRARQAKRDEREEA